jgi:hypothetical protein
MDFVGVRWQFLMKGDDEVLAPILRWLQSIGKPDEKVQGAVDALSLMDEWAE